MADTDNNFLNMSDEEMMNAPAPDFTPPLDAPEIETPAEVEEKVEIPSEEPEAKPEEGLPDDKAKAEGDEEDAVKSDKEKIETQKAEVIPTEKDIKKEVADIAINYEAEYKRLLAPFKANGREVVPKSVDDLISLAQMGANYNKKMAALKPNLKLMKMLENNGLLSVEKLSYLIDLDKKSPGAINKLVKDSGIDPMDLDIEKAGEYTPKIHTVDDREMDLDTVLDEIQGSKSYTRTLEIVSKEWDGASKQAIANAPQLLKVINDHVDRGIYDMISKEVDRERMFGRLNGVSDLEAYRQVGDAIQASGGFNHLGNAQGNSTPKVPVIVTPKTKVIDDTLNDKKRAASSTRTGTSSVASKDFNPLAMSDEEFMKMANASR